MHIEQNILNAVNEWLTPTFDNQTQEEIKEIMTTSPKELEDRFYKNLEFGTGGMRGIMGIGTNRINKYTLGKNTQGIANYMHRVFPGKELKVAMINPEDIQTIDFIRKKTGLKLIICLTTEESINSVLRQYEKSLKADFGDIIDTGSHNAILNKPFSVGISPSIYPNPFSRNLQLNYEGNKHRIALLIHSIDGKLVYQNNAYQKESPIDLSHLEDGFYFLKLIDKELGTKTIKIQKTSSY